MAGCAAKHHAHKVGLGEARYTTLMGGGYPKVSESCYRAVVQVILLYGLGAWVLSASMKSRIEGTHTEFLQMITGKRKKKLGDGTWETPGEEGIHEAAGT